MHLLLLLIILISYCDNYCYDRSHFYRASSFSSEPRFQRFGLTSFDLQLSGGSTEVGRNGCSQKTDLLSIYNNKSDCSFISKFTIFEINANLYQNINDKFFLHFHAPFAFTQLWIDEHNRKKCFKQKKIDTSGPADVTLFVGSTFNYEQTEVLDFIDNTLQLGILFPNSSINYKSIFNKFPLGYRGHYAFAINYDSSFGILDWITSGIHIESLFFFNRHLKNGALPKPMANTENTSYNTDVKITAISKPLWRFGWYLKADHFVQGLSILFAFSYEKKGNSYLLYPNLRLSSRSTQTSPEASSGTVGDPEALRFLNSIPFHHRSPDFASSFDGLKKERNIHSAITNNQLKSWSRAIFHLLLEYDFSEENSPFGPRIIFSYNKNLTGKRIFQTNTLTSCFAFDFVWCF